MSSFGCDPLLNRPAKPGQHYELVVRPSGGGPGIYTQVEDHYRIFHNELRNGLQFVGPHYGSDPTGSAGSERR